MDWLKPICPFNFEVGGLKTESTVIQLNTLLETICTSFTEVIYICIFCKSIHIRLRLKERSSKQLGGGRVVRWCWVNFQCRGVLLIWTRVGQGPFALAVGEGGRGVVWTFFLSSILSPLFLSLSGRRPDTD